jgi:hypothetical protein
MAQAQLTDKIRKYLQRRYIVPADTITSVVDIFPVKKGKLGDIRPVWNATESRVNLSARLPRFYMPSTGDTLCRKSGAVSADLDIGEMFLNFRLHPVKRRYQGVNLPKELWKEAGAKNGQNVLLMGFSPSPYLASRLMQRAVEYGKGDPKEAGYPFGFTKVVLN